ncbi:MAG: hypothetical protein OEO17_16840, partial [Gemmatimonadota bacterium]|nr:hypothetical protein [Gemmatimonadota bacterium]
PTAADFPGIDSIETTFDPDVQINGVLEVLDTASAGVTTQDFGPDLGEVFVWQGFMDIPKDAVCTVQLRARDADGEVICTATEAFDTNTVPVGGTVKVNVLMYCGISFQAPVAMLDLDGDFSFNIANFCPDLFILNCIDSDIDIQTIPGIGEVAATACQVRYRDGDSTCGTACDPQCCEATADGSGLTCTQPGGPVLPGACGDPGPEPPLTTTVSCGTGTFHCAIPGPLFGSACIPTPGDTCFDLSGGIACVPAAVIDCDGAPNPGLPDASCPYTGDTLGNVGDGPPGPLNPGIGGFFVACVLADNDGDPLTPEVPVAPGSTVTCTADTTDGDTDCDKQKIVQVTCPGLSPCQTFAAGGGTCSICAACDNAVCDGASAATCCTVPQNEGVDCSSENPPLASCQGGVCTTDACASDADCEDAGTACLVAPPGACDLGTGICAPEVPGPAGVSCNSATGGPGVTGTCNAAGTCVDNCTGVVCDDGNACTDDPACDAAAGGICPPPVNDDTNTCTTCASGTCVCLAGACIDGCTVPADQNNPGIPMACRNSFNQVVSTFPIDLLNVSTGGECVLSGTPMTISYDPVIALDTAFLQAAAETLCDLGTALTQADVTVAQVSVDEVLGGATCTEQLSLLTPVPQTVILDVTVTGICGAGGSVTVNSGVSLPLPSNVLPCTPGAVGADMALCSTGTVPLNITLANPPVQSFVGVSVSGGAIQVVFQCNTSSTTSPAPGVTVSCTAPNPTGACAALPPGNVGATPFPVSDCDFSGGFPGSCTTVPVGVDPLTVCPTYVVQ